MPRPRTAGHPSSSNSTTTVHQRDDREHHRRHGSQGAAESQQHQQHQQSSPPESTSRMVSEEDLWKEWKQKFRQHSQAVARDRKSYVVESKKAPLRTSPVARETSPRPRPSLMQYSPRAHTRARAVAQEKHKSGGGTQAQPWPFAQLSAGDEPAADKEAKHGATEKKSNSSSSSNTAAAKGTSAVMLSFGASRKKKKKIRRVAREVYGKPKTACRPPQGSVKLISRVLSHDGPQRWATQPSPFSNAVANAKAKLARDIDKKTKSGHANAVIRNRRLLLQRRAKARQRSADEEEAKQKQSQPPQERRVPTLSGAEQRAAALRRQINLDYVRRHNAKVKTFGRGGRKERVMVRRKKSSKHKSRNGSGAARGAKGGVRRTVPAVQKDIMVYLS